MSLLQQARLLIGHVGMASVEQGKALLASLPRDPGASIWVGTWAEPWQRASCSSPDLALPGEGAVIARSRVPPIHVLATHYRGALRTVDLGFWPLPEGRDLPVALLAAMQADAHRPEDAAGVRCPLSALAIQRWRKQLERLAVSGEWPDEIRRLEPPMDARSLVVFADGARIVRLLTPADLDAEGLRMQHCLRSVLHYASEAQLGAIALYSYRDPKGRPVATWELDLGAIRARSELLQLQGPGNGRILDAVARRRIAQVLDMTLSGDWRRDWGHRVMAAREGHDASSGLSWVTFLRAMGKVPCGEREDALVRVQDAIQGRAHAFTLGQPAALHVFAGHVDIGAKPVEVEGLHGEFLRGLRVYGLKQLPAGGPWMLTVVEDEWVLVSRLHVLRVSDAVESEESGEVEHLTLDPVAPSGRVGSIAGPYAMAPDVQWWDILDPEPTLLRTIAP